MRFREIADARNVGKSNGGSEPGKSSSAERRLRNVLASFSNRPSIVTRVFTWFLCTDFVAGTALVNLEVQFFWQAQRFVNLEVQISWQA